MSLLPIPRWSWSQYNTSRTFFPRFCPNSVLAYTLQWFSRPIRSLPYGHPSSPLPPFSPWPFHTLRWNVIDCVRCDQGCKFALKVGHSQWNLTKKQLALLAFCKTLKRKAIQEKKKMHKLLSVIWMVSFNGLPIVSKVAALSYNSGRSEVWFDLHWEGYTILSNDDTMTNSNANRCKTIGLMRKNNHSTPAIHGLVHFFAVLCETTS